jgi:hypothetical protein
MGFAFELRRSTQPNLIADIAVLPFRMNLFGILHLSAHEIFQQ